MGKSIADLFATFRQARPPDPVWLARQLQRVNAPEADRSTARQLIVEYANAHNENTLLEGYMPGARLEAARALSLLGLEAVVDDLLEWLTDWAPTTRQAVILALGRTQSPRAVAPLLQIALHDTDRVHLGEAPGHPGHYWLRCSAILALEAIASAEALAALATIPADSRAQVQAWKYKSYATLTEFGY
jgi:HEAT repeat protein